METQKRKNIAVSLITALLAAAGLFKPAAILAQEEVVCTVVYGQGEVCGVRTTREQILASHTPIEAGLEDINFVSVAAALGIAGALFFLLSKVTKRFYLIDR